MSKAAEWKLPEDYSVTIVVFKKGEPRPVWGSGASADHPDGVEAFLQHAALVARSELEEATKAGSE